MNVIDPRVFGALADGTTLDTAALQRAIDAAPRGAAVRLGGGTFRSGTLKLHSGSILEIASDAVLEGAPDIADYRDCGFRHREMGETLSLLYALGADDVEIRGGGTIRFNGSAFINHDIAPGLPKGFAPETAPPDIMAQTVCTMKKRPTQPVFFDGCRHIRVHDIKAVDSPCWTFTFSACDDIAFERVVVDNNLRIPNNDGIHVSASSRILVRDCDFSCGDDCFAATCITHPDGECRDIVVERCRMLSHSAAIRVGHSTARAIFRDIQIEDSNRGLCVYADKYGGRISDIRFERVDVSTRILAGEWWGKGEPFVVSGIGAKGEIDGVVFKECRFTGDNPCLVMGERGNVRRVALERCSLRHETGPAPACCRKRIDLRPNVPVSEAPWRDGDTLYVIGAELAVKDGSIPPKTSKTTN